MGESSIFNKREAFLKCVESPQFKVWHKAEVARRLGLYKDVDKEVDRQMEEKNLKIEYINGSVA